MSPDLVVDYSFARPAPAAIRAAGYVAVARYLAPLPNRKVIDHAELEQLHAEGLAVVLVWESTADRAGQGYDAGRIDAREADRQANLLGLPLERPLYFAVDYDAEPAAVVPYFRGAGAGTARPIGVYGSRRVVDFLLAANLARYGWQTAAWSHGQLSATAHLYQRLAATVPHPIPSTDENVALQPDYGQWPHLQEDDDDMAPAKTITFPDDPALGVNRGLVAAYPANGARPWWVPSTDALAIARELHVVELQHAGTITDRAQQAAVLASLDRQPGGR